MIMPLGTIITSLRLTTPSPQPGGFAREPCAIGKVACIRASKRPGHGMNIRSPQGLSPDAQFGPKALRRRNNRTRRHTGGAGRHLVWHDALDRPGHVFMM